MEVIVISLAFGASLALLAWQGWSLVRDVPAEDRQFHDRPALGFRLCWPLVRLLVHHGGALIGAGTREAVTRRLRRAGVQYSLSAEEFVMGKVVAAAVATLLAGILLSRLGNAALAALPFAALGGFLYPELWLRESAERRQAAILRELPFYLDVITLAVEAGSNLSGGLTQAVRKSSDSPLRRELARVLRDVRAGRTRADALREMAERSGSRALQNVVAGMIQAERSGSSLGPLLRAQADQLRSERFQRAEKRAMEAPVKLLGPLVLFIFPTTFLVLGFLVLSKAVQEGVLTWAPLVWAYHWPAA